MSIIHQYLIETNVQEKANKQVITEINIRYDDLTGVSSHFIDDIISYFRPCAREKY